ncbi:meiotic nuclear division protein 1 [Papiliotrema laurentii]|uniref:Meiotic nuclear division protein 1 n=1 Tax=Papiliotrema laurentii TaxID=5418 RepID=A0AAD9FXI0_PAPLA|nr:meiotic nuclear division protein 1 [Papiliotrema laurentii]
MSKRGLSMDEKKTKMVELFHETMEFYSLKELEKIAPKQKGIVQQSVKDVIDDLVGDGLVSMDKIGTGNYYWSFPSATGAMKTAAVAKAQAELDSINAKLRAVHQESDEANVGREDTAERRTLLAALQQAQAESAALKAELAAFGAADPVKYERKRQAMEVCKEAAQRWTDNTIILISFGRSLGIDESALREQAGIGEDWEDLPA